jgi:hypothetical protein
MNLTIFVPNNGGGFSGFLKSQACIISQPPPYMPRSDKFLSGFFYDYRQFITWPAIPDYIEVKTKLYDFSIPQRSAKIVGAMSKPTTSDLKNAPVVTLKHRNFRAETDSVV